MFTFVLLSQNGVAPTRKTQRAMSKTGWTVIGFLMFMLGFISLILQAVGLQFTFLMWLDALGPGWGFLFRLLILVAGLVVVYLVQTDWQEEEE